VAQSFDGPLHLVSDVVMPTMGGLDLARRVLLLRPDVRVLMVSGYSRQTQLPASMHFLPKPFTEAQLLEKVRVVPWSRPRRLGPRTGADGDAAVGEARTTARETICSLGCDQTATGPSADERIAKDRSLERASSAAIHHQRTPIS
jgi:DNA-binding NtrC family response regulator